MAPGFPSIPSIRNIFTALIAVLCQLHINQLKPRINPIVWPRWLSQDPLELFIIREALQPELSSSRKVTSHCHTGTRLEPYYWSRSCSILNFRACHCKPQTALGLEHPLSSARHNNMRYYPAIPIASFFFLVLRMFHVISETRFLFPWMFLDLRYLAQWSSSGFHGSFRWSTSAKRAVSSQGTPLATLS